MSAPDTLTAKGLATRDRIIGTAADLVLEHGAGGTSLDEIRAATHTSKGQLFHYFPGGKGDLIEAIAGLQSQRVLDAQRPYLDELDSWESWDGWAASVIAHYGAQRHLRCPIGALTAELVLNEPERAAGLAAHMDRWRGHLEAGLSRMVERGLLAEDADPARLALGTFASLHGGLTLMAMSESIEPLEAALDGALEALHAHAAG
jgi:AcrR family transcriptional regulator